MKDCTKPDVIAGKPCYKLNSDDWDELEDSCQNCGWWKDVEKKS